MPIIILLIGIKIIELIKIDKKIGSPPPRGTSFSIGYQMKPICQLYRWDSHQIGKNCRNKKNDDHSHN